MVTERTARPLTMRHTPTTALVRAMPAAATSLTTTAIPTATRPTLMAQLTATRIILTARCHMLTVVPTAALDPMLQAPAPLMSATLMPATVIAHFMTVSLGAEPPPSDLMAERAALSPARLAKLCRGRVCRPTRVLLLRVGRCQHGQGFMHDKLTQSFNF